MTQPFRTVLLTLAVGSLSIAATRLVAMRVDIEALGAAGDKTAVEVGIQIAPEDRSVMGRRVVLQMELTRGETTVDRVARSIELDSNGRAHIEVVWPPGVYDVRVEVERADGEESGLWLGKTRVPQFEPEATATPPAPPPAADAAAVAAAGGAATAVPPPPPPAPDAVRDPEPSSQAPPAQAPVEVEMQEPVERPEPAEAPTPAVIGRADDPSLADLTVLVTRRNRPVPGLERDDLELRVNGRPTTIEDIGAAPDTPLLLGVAADLSAPMSAQLPEMSRMLSGLAVRTLDAAGELCVVTADPDPTIEFPWGATPTDLANALARPGDSSEADIVSLISTALDQFEGRTGRKFLIVVTDGGGTSSKSDWKGSAPIVEAAGVPIFVVGVRAETQSDRTRRNLDRLATATGGKSYFVQNAGMVGMTTDYIADLIAGSYAIRFRPPAEAGLHRIEISTGDKDQTILHPKTMR